MRGVRRLVPRGSEPEDPKTRVKPRVEGEEASHELPGVLNGDSEARANRESGRQDSVTGFCLSFVSQYSDRPTAIRGSVACRFFLPELGGHHT